jgi:putative transposase
MYVKINGETHCLWRAVDHEGEVLESFASKTRDKPAALKFIRKLMKRHAPAAQKITTDGLRSYKAALTELGCRHKQEVGRWANNRVENSHQPLRRVDFSLTALPPFSSLHCSWRAIRK